VINPVVDFADTVEDEDRGGKLEARAKRFYNRYRTTEGRLRGIMLNIIKNGGTFKP
jgi:hypothetical protein